MAAFLMNGFWNRRELYSSLRACSQENICKEKVDEDDVKDTVSKLNSLVFKTKLLHLWSEAAILKRVVYKNGNQHRKQLYFQGLRRIAKSLSRLQETEIYNKLVTLRNTFPRLSKNGFFARPPSTLPSFGYVVSILGCLVGAAQLTVQIMSSCQETFKYSCAELIKGYFVTFHLTCVSSLSRVWVFLKDFMHSISQCYDVLFPWISFLENTKTEESPDAKDLPKSLKIWLFPSEGEHSNKKPNSTCGTPQLRLSTPGALDKLFGSTPRGHLQDSSSRISETIVNSLKESPDDDLGESCVLDEVTKSVKHRNALTLDKNFQPKVQLFIENPEEPKRQFTTKLGPEKRGAEIIHSEVSNTPTKIKDKELERPLHGAVVRRRSYSTTRIFANKAWKLVIEMAKRRKLAKRCRKIKGNINGSSKGVTKEEEGRKMKKQEKGSVEDDASLKAKIADEHSMDGSVVEAKMKGKMLRKRRRGRKITGNMRGSSKRASRENEGRKMKKREKDSGQDDTGIKDNGQDDSVLKDNGQDDTGIKVETKEEHIKDGTFLEAKMKTKSVRKRRHGSKIKDGTFAKKGRTEAFSDGEKGSSNQSRKRKRPESRDALQKITWKDKSSQDESDKRGKNNQDKREKKGKNSQDERDKKYKKRQISKGEIVMEKPRNQGHAIDSKRVEETLNFETNDHATEGEGNNNKTYGGNKALQYKLKKRKRKTGKHDTNQDKKTKQSATLGWRKRRRKGTEEHTDYMNDIDEIFSVLDD